MGKGIDDKLYHLLRAIVKVDENGKYALNLDVQGVADPTALDNAVNSKSARTLSSLIEGAIAKQDNGVVLRAIVSNVLKDGHSQVFGDFEFVAESEEKYLKQKLNLTIPFLGFRYYDEANDVVHLIGLNDTTTDGGAIEINYTTTDFVNNTQSIVQASGDGYAALMFRNLLNNALYQCRTTSNGVSLSWSDGSTFKDVVSVDQNGEVSFDVPEFADDASAGTGGVTSGKVYYNTTFGAYSKKQ